LFPQPEGESNGAKDRKQIPIPFPDKLASQFDAPLLSDVLFPFVDWTMHRMNVVSDLMEQSDSQPGVTEHRNAQKPRRPRHGIENIVNVKSNGGLRGARCLRIESQSLGEMNPVVPAPGFSSALFSRNGGLVSKDDRT